METKEQEKVSLNTEEKLKIVVTGGAGFVGSNLCERLVAEGHEVWSIDNYFTGSEDNHVDGVNYLNAPAEAIENLIEFKADYVFHLGEYSRVEQSFDDIKTAYEYNTNGIIGVLEYCRRFGSKLVYAGSSTKFADGNGPTQSPYAFFKAKNTELINAYSQWYGLNYATVYFYNVYGRRENAVGKYSTLIGKFANKMKCGEVLEITSPGTQVRNFTHIDDTVDGILIVARNGFGDGYGIGSEESWSVLDVARMFGGVFEFKNEAKGNRMGAKVETSKTRVLGWSPKNSLPNYIQQLKNNYWESV